MDDVDEFLAHFGVKGMRWGVRKDRQSSGEPSESGGSDHAKLKKALIIGGVVVGAAVITAGVVYAAKHGDIPTSSLSSAGKSAGKQKVDDLLKSKEPEQEFSGVLHSAGGKYKGIKVHSQGNLKDYLPEITEAFPGDSPTANTYKKYGKNLDKVAVSFLDPQGRKDFSGRPIVHEVALSKEHAAGINDHASAVAKAWPLVKDTYEKYWQSSLDKSAV